MSYSLGVDLGTTCVAAAIFRQSRAEMFALGDRTVVMPAVVSAGPDGSLLIGEAADRHSVADPDHACRKFGRRLGDSVSVVVGGTRYAVTSLLAALLSDVVRRVTAVEGASPDQVILTHPTSWEPHRLELFKEVPKLAGVPQAVVVAEPVAAATHHAAAGHLVEGDAVVVYDLGGGTFDATVLRRSGNGIEIVGTPAGIERLGGVDFDDAILSYVNYSTGGALSALDLSTPQTAVDLARLLEDCILAKEALSVDVEATIPVFLPNRHFDVRLTRTQFEDMIRADIDSTINALGRTLRSAQVEPTELSAVLLVGGSARIPLVTRTISHALRLPTVLDAHPQYAVALGAATVAATLAPQTSMSPQSGTAGRGGATSVAGRPVQNDGTAATTGTPGPVASGYTGPGLPGTSPHSRRQPESGLAARPVAGGEAGPPPARYPSASDAWRVDAADGAAHLASLAAKPGRRRRGWIVAATGAVLITIGSSVYLGTGAGNGVRPDPAVLPPFTVALPTAGQPTNLPSPPAVSLPIPATVGELPVGRTPGYVAIAPDGTFAYIANRAAGVVTVVDTAVNQVVATIPIPDGPPQYLAFAPDGKRLYVSVFDDRNRSINRVAVLDTGTNTVLTTVPVGTRPYALDVTPDGSQIYVPNHDSGTVSVIDTATNAVVTDIRVKPNPHWVEFSQDGSRAYTANHESNLISVIDTATRSVVAEVPVQVSPHSVAVHPSLPLVANVNYDSNSLTVIDTDTEQVISTIAVGTHPQDVTWAPDGRHLYVTNVDSDNLTVIAADRYRVTATVPTGDAPTSVAVTPDGRSAYVSNLNSGTLTVLDLAR